MSKIGRNCTIVIGAGMLWQFAVPVLDRLFRARSPVSCSVACSVLGRLFRARSIERVHQDADATSNPFAAHAATGLERRSMNMATPDELRHTRIPLTHGSGAIPAVGFGTLIPDPLVTKQATRTALEVGFRHLEGAERYRNEEAVGDAMQEMFKTGTIRRQDVFVTTKLWNTNHRPERVKPAFDASLRRLQLDYVDCYLIHTPFAFRPGDEQDPRDEHGQVIYDRGVTLVETWQAFERLVEGGHCKAIGLSDVNLEKLRQVVAAARIKPAVVQVESHPYLPEWELLDFCREHGIVLLAFAALGHAMKPRLLDDPVITGIAQRVHKTPAQVALAWAAQRGTAFLTTSTSRGHIQENFEISALPEDAMREMRDGITTNVRFNTVVETGVPGFIPRGS
jgi:diketogulonate reductase-like aldo/keto reductase